MIVDDALLAKAVVGRKYKQHNTSLSEFLRSKALALIGLLEKGHSRHSGEPFSTCPYCLKLTLLVRKIAALTYAQGMKYFASSVNRDRSEIETQSWLETIAA